MALTGGTGLKLDLATTVNPETSAKSALFTAHYKQPALHSRAVVDLLRVRPSPFPPRRLSTPPDGRWTGPDVHARLGRRTGRLPRRRGRDLRRPKGRHQRPSPLPPPSPLSDAGVERRETGQKYNAAIGYSAPEYAVTLHGLGNLSTFHASYYHKVNRDVEAGAKASVPSSPPSPPSLPRLNRWDDRIYDTKSPSKAVSLEVGTRAYLDNASFVKARINNSGILGLGYTQALRPGVKVSLGLALDTQKISGAGGAATTGGEGEKAASGGGGAAHRVGASFTFES